MIKTYVTQLSLEPGQDMFYSKFLAVRVDLTEDTSDWDNFDLGSLIGAVADGDTVTATALLNALRLLPCIASADYADYTYH